VNKFAQWVVMVGAPVVGIIAAWGCLFGAVVVKSSPDRVTMTMICEPEQALAFEGYSDGTVKPVEDWVAECKVYSGGKKIYEGSFSAAMPESRALAAQESHTMVKVLVYYLKQMRDADVPERDADKP